jgi:hypothetical protein
LEESREEGGERQHGEERERERVTADGMKKFE